MRLLKALIFILIVLAAAVTTYAADYVLVLESSKEMKQKDPGDLRLDAAMLFVRLLGSGDRVSVVRYSDDVEVLTELQDAKAGRFGILRSIAKIDSNGLRKDMFRALSKAVEILTKEGSDNKNIILLSDGKMDLGSVDKNEEYTLRLIKEILPECKSRGIRIYTIAFSNQADITLLKDIAHTTRGLFYKVNSPDRIHLAFADIFSNSKLSDEIPIKDRLFLVDKKVKEMWIVLTKAEGKNKVALLQPDGRKVTRRKHPSHYRWYSSKVYEFVKITRPMVGKWKILDVNKDGSRVFIISDLTLKITDIPRVIKKDRKVKIYVWLQEEDKILKGTPLILKAVEFKVMVIRPDNSIENIKLNDEGIEDDDLPDDGVYTGSTMPEEQGEYRVKVEAQGRAFERLKVIKFYAQKQKNTPVKKEVKREKPVEEVEKKVQEENKQDDNGIFRKALIKFAVFNAVLLIIVAVGIVIIKRKIHKGVDEEN